MTLPKSKYWYHGTSIDAARNILKDGYLRNFSDGIYFTNTSNYAGTFCSLRGYKRYAVIKVPRSMLVDKLKSAHDHTYELPRDCHFAVYTGSAIPITDDMIEYWEE